MSKLRKATNNNNKNTKLYTRITKHDTYDYWNEQLGQYYDFFPSEYFNFNEIESRKASTKKYWLTECE